MSKEYYVVADMDTHKVIYQGTDQSTIERLSRSQAFHVFEIMRYGGDEAVLIRDRRGNVILSSINMPQKALEILLQETGITKKE